MLEILFFPFVALIALPPLALVPAALLAACLRLHRPEVTGSGRGWVLAGAVSWSVYAIYECLIWLWSQDVIVPIRVDLLLIAPFLYVLSFLAVRSCWQAARRGRSARRDAA